VDPRSSTVDDVLRRSAARVPARVALRFEDRVWTYAELEAAVSRAGAALAELDVTKGDRVAAYGRNSDAYLIGFLACARAGLIHVPVNYNLVGDDLTYLVDQSGSSAVLADPDLAPRLPEHLSLRQVPLRDAPGSLLERASTGPVPELDVTVDDTDLVQLLYTSGTTSQPKGAMMTHRALLHEYVSCVLALDLDEQDVPLHVMPLYHSAQLHVFLMPALLVGATNHLVEVPEPGDVLERIERGGNTSFFAAPTLWVALSNHPDLPHRDLSSLRKAYYGASIMPVPVLRKLRETLPQLGFYNAFGQSEIAPLATVLRPEDHVEGRLDSAGRPVLFVELRVVDETGADVATGEQGEVVYRSPQLATGYWDKPAETAAAFRDGWFHSGDLVRQDEDGFIYVVDRVKDVINTGGVLVASRDVEDALYTHPGVAEVAVIGVSDPKWIEAITAIVVVQEGTAAGNVTEKSLIAHAREHLSPFKVPKQVHLVTDLPRNASGKLLKRVLRDRFTVPAE